MRHRGLTMGVFLVLATLGCEVRLKAGHYEEDERAARGALRVFHERYNAEDFEAIYDNGSEGLRALPKAEVVAGVRQIRQTLGRLVGAEVKAAECFPNEVRLLVRGQFEQGEMGELFVWHVPGEEALLATFRVFPGPVKAPAGLRGCRSR